MTDLQKEAGRDCPSPLGARRSAAVKVRRRPPRPPAHAVRADLDGQTAVARWAHQQASPLPLPAPVFPQAKRAAPQARRRQRSAPERVETPDGSMRSTRARSGTAGDARNRQTSKPLPTKPDEEQNLLYCSATIRKGTKQQSRLYDGRGEVRSPHSAHPAPRQPPPSSIRGRRRTRQGAPPKRGAGATRISRPCCVSRSGCARRPRPRPDGRRWWPGTRDRPASPTGKADPPC